MNDQATAVTPRKALAYFFYLAEGHCHGAAKVAATLLLSCYNGHRFQFDVTDLRLLDDKHLDMALQIMRFDARLTREVHDHLNDMYHRTDFGPRFEHLAHRWALKGKCPKSHLSKLEPVTFANPLETPQATP